jgi:hypothetical protein
MLPHHFQPPQFAGPAEVEGADTSSSDSSSDEEGDACSDIGDPFEDVDEGGLYAFKVRTPGQPARVLHRRIIR